MNLSRVHAPELPNIKETIMKSRFAALAAPVLAGFVLALPANAGGMNEPVAEPAVMAEVVPTYAPSADWSGGYVGAQLGYGDIGSTGAVLDGNGTIGGVHAGYRMDYGSFVSGVELSYDATNIDLGAAGDTLDDVARLKLIAGADMGSTLVYASAGVARASATLGGVSASDNGYFLGLGADYAISNKWTVGAELLGHRFNDFNGSGVDLKATTVQAKVAYRF